MTNPPTPPTEVPPMPKADTFKYGNDGSSGSVWFTNENGTTPIEQWGEQGWAKAAEAEAEVKRLREAIRKTQRYTNGTANRILIQALTPKETTDD